MLFTLHAYLIKGYFMFSIFFIIRNVPGSVQTLSPRPQNEFSASVATSRSRCGPKLGTQVGTSLQAQNSEREQFLRISPTQAWVEFSIPRSISLIWIKKYFFSGGQNYMMISGMRFGLGFAPSRV